MSQPIPADWPPCPPGELERLAARLAFRAKLRLAAGAGAAALATAVVATGGWYTYAVLAGPSDVHEQQEGCCGGHLEPPLPPPIGPETKPTGAK